MKTLEQYHFDRDYFTSVFDEIFANRCFDLEVACQEHRETENFLLYYKDDEFYIIHFDSEMERHPEWYDRVSTSSGFKIYWGVKLKEAI